VALETLLQLLICNAGVYKQSRIYTDFVSRSDPELAEMPRKHPGRFNALIELAARSDPVINGAWWTACGNVTRGLPPTS
jgi:hypothetical protein